MKTILTTWLLALTVYVVTPYVYAGEAGEVIWTGYNVVGDVCLEIKSDEAGVQGAQLQVLNHQGVKLVKLKAGLNCLDIAMSSKTALRTQSAGSVSSIELVTDNTTPFVTIELPF